MQEATEFTSGHGKMMKKIILYAVERHLKSSVIITQSMWVHKRRILFKKPSAVNLLAW